MGKVRLAFECVRLHSSDENRNLFRDFINSELMPKVLEVGSGLFPWNCSIGVSTVHQASHSFSCPSVFIAEIQFLCIALLFFRGGGAPLLATDAGLVFWSWLLASSSSCRIHFLSASVCSTCRGSHPRQRKDNRRNTGSDLHSTGSLGCREGT